MTAMACRPAGSLYNIPAYPPVFPWLTIFLPMTT
jgi:hypothetical protein